MFSLCPCLTVQQAVRLGGLRLDLLAHASELSCVGIAVGLSDQETEAFL